MFRDDKIADMESAFIERDKAKQELDVAQKRIGDMEALLREKEKECEDAKKELGSHHGDADEIASLRNALYRATREDDRAGREESGARNTDRGDRVLAGILHGQGN